MQRVWGDRITFAAFIGLAVYLGTLAWEFPAGGGTFPLFAEGGIVVLSLLGLAKSFIAPTARQREEFRPRFDYGAIKPYVVAGLTVVYILAVFWLGYFSSTFLFMVIVPLVVGLRRLRGIVVALLVLFPFLYGFFIVFLNARLPRGILF